jgi:hypothetical protein
MQQLLFFSSKIAASEVAAHNNAASTGAVPCIIRYNNVPFQTAIASDPKALGDTFIGLESVLAAKKHCVHIQCGKGTPHTWCHSSPCSCRDGIKETVKAHGA